MSLDLTNVKLQAKLITGAGVKPTVPTVEPGDPDWQDTDILKGEWCLNITDDLLYMRGLSGILGPFECKKNNYAATTNPGADNDVTEGYSKASQWFNLNDPADPYVWICINPAEGAAVWKSIGLI